MFEWAIFTPADVAAFTEVWYRKMRGHSASDHQVMNSVLDAVVERFLDHEEEKCEEFRRQLTAYRNLYVFLSPIIPYQDTDLERLYAYARNLLAKLPSPDDGQAFVLDDEVALSRLIDRLNERFGTDFTEADQLFFDQTRASAENDKRIAEAAHANSFTDFAAFLDGELNELFIARMEANGEIFSKVMTNKEFRSAAHGHLAHEIVRRVR